MTLWLTFLDLMKECRHEISRSHYNKGGLVQSAPAGYITADLGTGGWRWGYGMFCVMFVRIHSLQLSSMAD